MADDKRRKDEELSEEERRWIDRLINPLDGPASENAYPEDMTIEVDGKQVSMNQSARRYNQAMGYTDKAAGTPWRGPEGKGAGTRPEGSQIRGTEEQLAEQVAERARFEALEQRFEKSKLKSASQLPDLEGEDLEITWDFEEGPEGEDDSTVLRHGDQIIWREIGLKEAIPRFDQVIWILREKYGSRLAALKPTQAARQQLRTLGFVTQPAIDELNEELRDKRGPLEPKGTIEVEEADTDKPDPESQEEELMASIREMGWIDCSCGWVGEATEARVIGTGSARNVNCPDCRRPLYMITIDE